MINAKRRKEAPASLARGTYAGDDVLQALHQDFQGKCYLCELQLSLRDIAVDPAAGDVEARLLQTMSPSEAAGDEVPFFAAVDASDRAAENTARELDHIHNARGSIKAADLRRAIAERIDEVLTMRIERERSGGVTGPVLRACEDGLREAFSRRAPFTALIRGRLGSGFEHLFD